MIKLLIADDEPLVLVGLKSMLNWSDFNIEICGTARNGAQALEIIEKEHPQLVIADIKMPVKTGIELMQECREKYGSEQQFIILTSYEEREYLRMAITLSAVEYLIKVELTKENLSKAVFKAVEIITKQLKNEPDETEDKQSFRDKFFIRLLNNLFESKDLFMKQKNDLEIDLHWAFYRVCYCEMGSGTEKDLTENDKKKHMQLYNSTLQMVKETCSRFCPCITVSIDLRRFAIIFCFDTDINTKETVKDSFEKTAAIIKNYFSVTLTAAVGSKVSDSIEISTSFFAARGAFSQKKKENSIIFSEDLSGGKNDETNFDILNYKTIITKALSELDSETLFKTITELSSYLETHPQSNVQAMDAAGMILYTAISIIPDGEKVISDIFKGESDGYKSLYKMHTSTTISAWLLKLGNGLYLEINKRRNNYKNRLLIKIEQYIKANIDKRITLNETAELFNISANYLGQQFAKYSSCSFNEYVNREKIEKAKTLIQKNELKMYEIADNLGFESAFYFSKVFKKQTGVSPREYSDSVLRSSQS